MIIYIIYLAYISALAVLIYAKGSSKKKNKWFITCSLTILTFIQACRRQDVGIDVPTYIEGFNVITQSIGTDVSRNMVKNWEPLWKLYNRVIGIFTFNPQWFIAITSILIIIGVGVFIFYNVENNESAFWEVFFFMTISNVLSSTMYLLRQSMATVLVINIYTVFNSKKIQQKIPIAVVLLILGALIHSSSLFIGVIILGVCMQKKIRKNFIFLILSCIAGIVAAYPLLLQVLVKIVPKYRNYFHLIYFQPGKIRMYSILLMVLILGSMYLVVKYINPKKNRELYLLLEMNLISIAFVVLTLRVSAAQRFATYFQYYVILMLPKLIRKIKNGWAILIILYIASWVFYIYFLKNSPGKIVPYYFFWETS